MPYIKVKTNKKIMNDQEERMKNRLGELIEILGK